MSRAFALALPVCAGSLLIAYAQDTASLETELPEHIVESLEELIAQNTGTEEFNTALEHLQRLYQHPLNLNSASTRQLEELATLGILTFQQVASIIEYRTKYGAFRDVGELVALPGFSPEQVSVLRHFFTAEEEPRSKIKELVRNIPQGTHNIIFRMQRYLELAEGFKLPDTSSQKFLGDPWRIYLRYQYWLRRELSWGFTAEKDAGEQLFTGYMKPQPFYKIWQGFDFFSAYFQVSPGGIVKNLILGDYEIRFGQGLVAWTGFGFGKSSYVLTFKRTGVPLRPYTSVNEVRFLRGAALHLQKGSVGAILFASSKRMDASTQLAVDTLGDTTTVATYLSDYGYHRNLDELQSAKNVRQQVVGARLFMENNWLKAGLTAIHTSLDKPLGVYRERPYNKFYLRGNQLTNLGADYELNWRNFYLFGEAGYSLPGSWATTHGILASLCRQVNIGILYRYISPDYHSLLHNPVTEYYRGENEEGIYLAVQAYPLPRWELSAYYDIYRHPWLRWERDAPTRGYDYVVRLQYEERRKLQAYILYKNELRQENERYSPEPIPPLRWVRYSYLRLHLRRDFNRHLRYTTRLQLSFYDNRINPSETGYMLYQEIKYHSHALRTSFYARLAYFHTPSWDSRIYVYETDVLYYFSVPAYYGHGLRYYLMASIYVNRHLTLWIRLARTLYLDRDFVGSNLNRTDGPARTELKLQARLRL